MSSKRFTIGLHAGAGALRDSPRRGELEVLDSFIDEDQSVVALSDKKFETMGLIAGDTLHLQGRGGRFFVCNVVMDPSLDHHVIRIGQVARKNLDVRVGERVTISRAQLENATTLYLKLRSGSLDGRVAASVGARAFFASVARPVSEGGRYLIDYGRDVIEVNVVKLHPHTAAVTAAQTNIVFLGEAAEEHVHEVALDSVAYESVGGTRKQLVRIRELLDPTLQRLPTRHPYGARFASTRTILLHGPPGGGKRLLAKALAMETRSRLVLIQDLQAMDSDAVRVYLRRKYEEAGRSAPCVVLIEDLDLSCPREQQGELLLPTSKQLAELMANILDSLPRTVILGLAKSSASVNIHMRARFLRTIELGNLDQVGRLDVLTIHSSRLPLDVDVDLVAISMDTRTHDFVGADVAELCDRALRHCIHETCETLDATFMLDEATMQALCVTSADFLGALDDMAKLHPPQGLRASARRQASAPPAAAPAPSPSRPPVFSSGRRAPPPPAPPSAAMHRNAGGSQENSAPAVKTGVPAAVAPRARSSSRPLSAHKAVPDNAAKTLMDQALAEAEDLRSSAARVAREAALESAAVHAAAHAAAAGILTSAHEAAAGLLHKGEADGETFRELGRWDACNLRAGGVSEGRDIVRGAQEQAQRTAAMAALRPGEIAAISACAFGMGLPPCEWGHAPDPALTELTHLIATMEADPGPDDLEGVVAMLISQRQRLLEMVQRRELLLADAAPQLNAKRAELAARSAELEATRLELEALHSRVQELENVLAQFVEKSSLASTGAGQAPPQYRQQCEECGFENWTAALSMWGRRDGWLLCKRIGGCYEQARPARDHNASRREARPSSVQATPPRAMRSRAAEAAAGGGSPSHSAAAPAEAARGPPSPPPGRPVGESGQPRSSSIVAGTGAARGAAAAAGRGSGASAGGAAVAGRGRGGAANAGRGRGGGDGDGGSTSYSAAAFIGGRGAAAGAGAAGSPDPPRGDGAGDDVVAAGADAASGGNGVIQGGDAAAGRGRGGGVGTGAGGGGGGGRGAGAGAGAGGSL